MAAPEGLILYKRWVLKPGVSVDDVWRFVQQEIAPRYAVLSANVTLDLEADADGRSVLAIQRWTSADAQQRAMSGPAFDAWWREYEPRLTAWDDLVDFDDEWSTVPVDLGPA